jgi:Domain of unknown function (DUF4249)
MKNIFFTLVISFLLINCTEVVDVKLDTESPRLVIEAIINWEKGTSGNEQKIKLSTTTNFYTNKIPVVSDATVVIKNSDNIIYDFTEISNTGVYVCNNFVPVLNETYTLTIVSSGKTYNATETLKPVSEITISQEIISGFNGERIRIKANFLDAAQTEDYYLFNYKYPSKAKADYYVSDDKFFNGNLFFSTSFGDNVKQNDLLKITHYGISRGYYEYLNILLNLSGNQGGGPFQAPPVTVRGNILNTSNQEDFPFGFFSLSETDTKEYKVE